MDTDGWFDDLVAPGRALGRTSSGLPTSLTTDHENSTYDRHAGAYDRLIGNGLYNRLAWGTSPAEYRGFARQVVAGGSGPVLDVGCGTAVFTAEVYRSSARPLVLVDRSAGMLARARRRMGPAPAGRVEYVVADLFDLPFRRHAFPTVTSYGVLHLFDDLAAVLRVLREQVAPGGELRLSCLAGETRVGRGVLRALHRAGEIARPRRATEVIDVARTELGQSVRADRRGCMLFLTSRPTPDAPGPSSG